MSGLVILRRYPSGTDCIRWSLDCMLAVATGEYVDILVPRLESHNRVGNDSRTQEQTSLFEIIPLQINRFTKKELPVKPPAPSEICSIGEEISLNTAVAVEWSLPGLGKHRRSALGVLTTGLVLSIWAPISDPKTSSNWRRSLVVNTELSRYFSSVDTRPENEGGNATLIQRRRQRIRAFSWSLSTNGLEDSSGRVLGNLHLLAVANDFNEIVILRIQSPYCTVSGPKEWSIRAICHFPIVPEGESESQGRIFDLDDFISQQRFASHLSWSPWMSNKDGVFQALLAYKTNSRIICRSLIASHLRFHFDISCDNHAIIDYALQGNRPGLLQWSPKLTESGETQLVMVTEVELISFLVSPHAKPREFTVVVSPLDENWDHISGMAFRANSAKDIEIHFSYLMSTAHTRVCAMNLYPMNSKPILNPIWQKRILESQALFSAEHSLKENVIAKIWGLVSSPLGDLITSCMTLHPADMPIYATPAVHRCTITISPMEETTSDFTLPIHNDKGGARGVTTEAIIYSIRRWLSASGPENPAATKENIFETIWKTLGYMTTSLENPDNTATIIAHIMSQNLSSIDCDLYDLSKALHRTLFLEESVIQLRYKNLVSIVCSPTKSRNKQDIIIAIALITAIKSLPTSIRTQSQYSRKVFFAYSQAYSKYCEIAPVSTSQLMDVDIEESQEWCEVCDSEIQFESLSWARCLQGHQFSRCGLTFLAVQEPGVSKFCGICKRQFLSEDILIDRDRILSENQDIIPAGTGGEATDAPEEAIESRNSPQEGNHAHTPLTLCQVLLTACDVCLYCGGNYVD